MILDNRELSYVRSFGAYITEKCDGCGKLLNQSFRYTTPGCREVWCSTTCQDRAMDWVTNQRHSSHKPAFRLLVCQRQGCGKRFRAARQDARFCSSRCRQWDRRKRGRTQNPVVTDNGFRRSSEPHKRRLQTGSEVLTPAFA
jgi:hypothetical protein